MRARTQKHSLTTKVADLCRVEMDNPHRKIAFFMIFNVFAKTQKATDCEPAHKNEPNNKRSGIPGYQKHIGKLYIFSESVKNTL